MTYYYPFSIEQAAKILDKDKPEWYKKIDISKLNMNNDYCCILGQIYGDYTAGMRHLFNYTIVHTDTCIRDCIFGRCADIQSWLKEINMRKEENKIFSSSPSCQFNFITASLKLKDKNKIIVRRLGKINSFLCGAFSLDGLTEEDIQANDWVEFNHYFYELLIGDKFYSPENNIYMGWSVKINDNEAVELADGKIIKISPNSKLQIR